MISVPNRLRLLSGNKLNISSAIFLVVIMLLSSCGGTDRVVTRTPRTKSPTPKKNTEVTKVVKKDKVKEVEWKEGKDEKKPPIKEPKKVTIDDIEILKEDVYDITYFLPFDARQYGDGSNASDRFLQYYSGMLIATEILEREGVNLNINVVDEKKERFENLLPSSINSETDLIVGPYSRTALKTAADYAAKENIPLVSPWQASSKIARENPYYIQLRPNLDQHYYSIFADIKENHSDLEHVHIVGRNTNLKDTKRVKKLQRMAKKVWGKSSENHLQELLVVQDSIDYGQTAFDSIFVADQPNVMIIPNWSFEDEAFIYGALRRLSVEKGITNVIVYGMPIMIESDKINFDQYSALNMKVARSKFVDERDSDVNRFKGDFLRKYGALPTDDAYEGYDNLMYIGRNITEYGKNFQYFLGKDDGYYLQAGYKVSPTKKGATKADARNVDYFENKNVDIIEFENNRFVRKID